MAFKPDLRPYMSMRLPKHEPPCDRQSARCRRETPLVGGNLRAGQPGVRTSGVIRQLISARDQKPLCDRNMRHPQEKQERRFARRRDRRRTANSGKMPASAEKDYSRRGRIVANRSVHDFVWSLGDDRSELTGTVRPVSRVRRPHKWIISWERFRRNQFLRSGNHYEG